MLQFHNTNFVQQKSIASFDDICIVQTHPDYWSNIPAMNSQYESPD